MPGDIYDQFKLMLDEITSELDEVEQDIKLLHEFNGLRDEHKQLSDSIRNQQKAIERGLEQLKLDLEDYGTAQDQDTAIRQLTTCEQRTRNLQRAFRSALAQYKTNTTHSARKERELLLSGAATPSELRKRKARTGNAVLNAASEVTTALQETVNLMNDEIEKSARNIASIEESSDNIRKTKEEHLSLDNIMATSRNLIRSLERADTLDRWLMLAGLVLFSFVVFNILRKRIWIPGLYSIVSIVRYAVTGGGASSAAAIGTVSQVASSRVQSILTSSGGPAQLVQQSAVSTLLYTDSGIVVDTAASEIVDSLADAENASIDTQSTSISYVNDAVVTDTTTSSMTYNLKDTKATSVATRSDPALRASSDTTAAALTVAQPEVSRRAPAITTTQKAVTVTPVGSKSTTSPIRQTVENGNKGGPYTQIQQQKPQTQNQAYNEQHRPAPPPPNPHTSQKIYNLPVEKPRHDEL